jgi:hypothetical protein
MEKRANDWGTLWAARGLRGRFAYGEGRRGDVAGFAEPCIWTEQGGSIDEQMHGRRLVLSRGKCADSREMQMTAVSFDAGGGRNVCFLDRAGIFIAVFPRLLRPMRGRKWIRGGTFVMTRRVFFDEQAMRLAFCRRSDKRLHRFGADALGGRRVFIVLGIGREDDGCEAAGS